MSICTFNSLFWTKRSCIRPLVNSDKQGVNALKWHGLPCAVFFDFMVKRSYVVYDLGFRGVSVTWLNPYSSWSQLKPYNLNAYLYMPAFIKYDDKLYSFKNADTLLEGAALMGTGESYQSFLKRSHNMDWFYQQTYNWKCKSSLNFYHNFSEKVYIYDVSRHSLSVSLSSFFTNGFTQGSFFTLFDKPSIFRDYLKYSSFADYFVVEESFFFLNEFILISQKEESVKIESDFLFFTIKTLFYCCICGKGSLKNFYYIFKILVKNFGYNVASILISSFSKVGAPFFSSVGVFFKLISNLFENFFSIFLFKFFVKKDLNLYLYVRSVESLIINFVKLFRKLALFQSSCLNTVNFDIYAKFRSRFFEQRLYMDAAIRTSFFARSSFQAQVWSNSLLCTNFSAEFFNIVEGKSSTLPYKQFLLGVNNFEQSVASKKRNFFKNNILTQNVATNKHEVLLFNHKFSLDQAFKFGYKAVYSRGLQEELRLKNALIFFWRNWTFDNFGYQSSLESDNINFVDSKSFFALCLSIFSLNKFTDRINKLNFKPSFKSMDNIKLFYLFWMYILKMKLGLVLLRSIANQFVKRINKLDVLRMATMREGFVKAFSFELAYITSKSLDSLVLNLEALVDGVGVFMLNRRSVHLFKLYNYFIYKGFWGWFASVKASSIFPLNKNKFIQIPKYKNFKSFRKTIRKPLSKIQRNLKQCYMKSFCFRQNLFSYPKNSLALPPVKKLNKKSAYFYKVYKKIVLKKSFFNQNLYNFISQLSLAKGFRDKKAWFLFFHKYFKNRVNTFFFNGVRNLFVLKDFSRKHLKYRNRLFFKQNCVSVYAKKQFTGSKRFLENSFTSNRFALHRPYKEGAFYNILNKSFYVYRNFDRRSFPLYRRNLFFIFKKLRKSLERFLVNSLQSYQGIYRSFGFKNTVKRYQALRFIYNNVWQKRFFFYKNKVNHIDEKKWVNFTSYLPKNPNVLDTGLIFPRQKTKNSIIHLSLMGRYVTDRLNQVLSTGKLSKTKKSLNLNKDVLKYEQSVNHFYLNRDLFSKVGFKSKFFNRHFLFKRRRVPVIWNYLYDLYQVSFDLEWKRFDKRRKIQKGRRKNLDKRMLLRKLYLFLLYIRTAKSYRRMSKQMFRNKQISKKAKLVVYKRWFSGWSLFFNKFFYLSDFKKNVAFTTLTSNKVLFTLRQILSRIYLQVPSIKAFLGCLNSSSISDIIILMQNNSIYFTSFNCFFSKLYRSLLSRLCLSFGILARKNIYFQKLTKTYNLHFFFSFFRFLLKRNINVFESSLKLYNLRDIHRQKLDMKLPLILNFYEDVRPNSNSKKIFLNFNVFKKLVGPAFVIEVCSINTDSQLNITSLHTKRAVLSTSNNIEELSYFVSQIPAYDTSVFFFISNDINERTLAATFLKKSWFTRNINVLN